MSNMEDECLELTDNFEYETEKECKFFAVWQTILLFVCHSFLQIVLAIGAHIVLPFIRLPLDTFWVFFQQHIWLGFPYAIAQDGKQVSSGCNFVRRVQYGSKNSETLDIILPTGRPLYDSFSPAVVYVHGGGWIAVRYGELLVQSMTPFVREGFAVYSVDYPLSPEHRFPIALISVLRSLMFLHKSGVRDIHLLGDSAGGNLVTMVATFLTNPHIFEQFASDPEVLLALSDDYDDNIDGGFSFWKFPNIICCASVYGILDQHSWKCSLHTITFIEKWLWNVALWFCFEMYRPADNSVFGNKLTIADLAHNIISLPPLLLIAGERDPLVLCSQYVHSLLCDRGLICELQTFPHRHAFLGIPPQATAGAWKTGAAPATQMILDWFRVWDYKASHSLSFSDTIAVCN